MASFFGVRPGQPCVLDVPGVGSSRGVVLDVYADGRSEVQLGAGYLIVPTAYVWPVDDDEGSSKVANPNPIP